MLEVRPHIDKFTGTIEQKFSKAKKVIKHKENIIKALQGKIKQGYLMEANRKEKCDFDVKIKDDIWNITACWLSAATDNICWYEGVTKRDGINVYRTFSSDEVELPEVKANV